MKKLLTLFGFTFFAFASYAQSVGIGTSSPGASAQLEIASTNKGLLIPRLTTMQRQAIPSPANGLLVYDTDFKEFYHYNGTAWRTILNSLVWTPSPTRKWIYNFTDSIGIGTATPAARLDVIGNVKTSARIDAAGVVEAAGLSSTGTLYVNGTSLLGGAVTGSTTGLFYGDVTSRSSFTINNSAAILNLQSASADKAFVQLNGDDLRVGTYSTNTTGSFIVRTGGTNNLIVSNDGRTGIGIDAPAAKLHINAGSTNIALRLQADVSPSVQFYSNAGSIGSIQATGSNLRMIATGNYVNINDELYVDDATNRVGIGTSTPDQKLHVTGNAKVTGGKLYNNENVNMLPVAYGYFTILGARERGTSNISATRVTSNDVFHSYDITVTGVDLRNAIIIVTAAGAQRFASCAVGGDNTASVYLYDNFSGETDFGAFNIVVYAPQ